MITLVVFNFEESTMKPKARKENTRKKVFKVALDRFINACFIDGLNFYKINGDKFMRRIVSPPGLIIRGWDQNILI